MKYKLSFFSSLTESKQGLTKKEIESSFGGNICRCTGYRPILEAFRKTSADPDQGERPNCQDIEVTYLTYIRNTKTNPGKLSLHYWEYHFQFGNVINKVYNTF